MESAVSWGEYGEAASSCSTAAGEMTRTVDVEGGGLHV